MDTTTTHRTFVSYIDRTREYYAAQGYERPYRWAQNADVPFAPLSKPLRESRVTIVTTASPALGQEAREGVLRGGKKVWSGATSETPERLYTDDLAWDKEATHTNDVDSFLPLTHLRAAVAAGRIGSVAPRFHGVPTDYSQRRTVEQDAPEVLARCQADETDVRIGTPSGWFYVREGTKCQLPFGDVPGALGLVSDVVFDTNLLVTEAQARVGRPRTPLSVAGAARRTTRRTIRRTTVYVAALPRGCTTVVIEGMALHQCGRSYYQPYGSQWVVVEVH